MNLSPLPYISPVSSRFVNHLHHYFAKENTALVIIFLRQYFSKLGRSSVVLFCFQLNMRVYAEMPSCYGLVYHINAHLHLL